MSFGRRSTDEILRSSRSIPRVCERGRSSLGGKWPGLADEIRLANDRYAPHGRHPAVPSSELTLWVASRDRREDSRPQPARQQCADSRQWLAMRLNAEPCQTVVVPVAAAVRAARQRAPTPRGRSSPRAQNAGPGVNSARSAPTKPAKASMPSPPCRPPWSAAPGCGQFVVGHGHEVRRARSGRRTCRLDRTDCVSIRSWCAAFMVIAAARRRATARGRH